MAENLAESEFRTWFLTTMRPDLVSPAVALLTHERCPINGELLVAGGGRVARTLFGETPGFVDSDLTPESVFGNLARVMDDTDAVVLRDGVQASTYNAEVLGFIANEPVTVVAGPTRARDTAHDTASGRLP